MNRTEIVAVSAMQTSTDTSYPAVQACVTTASGAVGLGNAFEAYSTSPWRPRYLYDNTEKYAGKAVATAVAVIESVVSPAIIGLDAACQGAVDAAITGALEKAGLLGFVNLSAPVSVAALKAGAAALGLPLYRHIGGRTAFTLPVGGQLAASGGKRYGAGQRSRGRPVYNLVSYGFTSFADAHYALWETANIYEKLLAKAHGILVHRGFALAVPAGRIESDTALLDIMAESIRAAGYEGKLGIHIDVGANEFYDPATGLYEGLFSAGKKTREDMLAFYLELATQYPLAILQDPLQAEDAEGFGKIMRATGLQIVGGDLLGTNPARIRECVDGGCVSSVLLPLCGFATVSEAFDVARYTKMAGADVMLHNLGGEGLDIADYAVGLGAGTVYQAGLDGAANRLLGIEEELGPRSRFRGRGGISGAAFSLAGGGGRCG